MCVCVCVFTPLMECAVGRVGELANIRTDAVQMKVYTCRLLGWEASESALTRGNVESGS